MFLCECADVCGDSSYRQLNVNYLENEDLETLLFYLVSF